RWAVHTRHEGSKGTIYGRRRFRADEEVMIEFVGKDHTLQLFGVRMLGITPDNGKKLLLSVVFILVLIGINRLFHGIAQAVLGNRIGRASFWARQVIRLL